MRTNPKGFASHAKDYLATYNDDGSRIITCHGSRIKMITNEGKKPVEELISFLESASPVGALSQDSKLEKAA